MNYCSVARLVLLFTLGCSQESATLSKISPDEPAVRLGIEPLGEQYCGGDDEVGSLQVRVLFHFRNVSKKPLILWKGSGAILRQMEARSEEDLANKRFESSALVTTAYSPSNQKISRGTQPGSDFVILPPDGSLETRGLIPILFKRTESKLPALGPGPHFVQVRVETWPESAELGKRLHDRWKKRGELWFKPSVVSAPMSVTIKLNPVIEPCE
jgi:hypothetical protein